VEVLQEERPTVGLDGDDAVPRLALAQSFPLHHRADPGLERGHHEDPQRLAAARG
jgi:hypothetical protein